MASDPASCLAGTTQDRSSGYGCTLLTPPSSTPCGSGRPPSHWPRVRVASPVSTVAVKTTINAPIDKVWEVVMDPNRLKDWVTIHRGVSQVSSQPLRAGSEMEQTLSLRGVNFRVHWTLVDVQPPNRPQWDGRGPAHSRALIRYQLADDGNGATTFEYTNEFKTPGG